MSNEFQLQKCFHIAHHEIDKHSVSNWCIRSTFPWLRSMLDIVCKTPQFCPQFKILFKNRFVQNNFRLFVGMKNTPVCPFTFGFKKN